MHGRIKTISTEEQKLIQEKKRAVKLKAYQEAFDLIKQKRIKEEYEDTAIKVSQEMLLANPDIITLWNFRREIFLYMLSTIDEELLQKNLEKELVLTEQCLRVNPKSYGAWHHREWTLRKMPSCDWKREVILCNKYLALDERNFHCWDYRRIVAEKAEVSNDSEYAYTTEKIEVNFSNYSAWHYRSKLLPKLFPDPEGKFPIAEETHKNELDMVQNAAFTDPDDQSAWFYLRWLLNLRQPPLRTVYAYLSNYRLIIVLSQPVNLNVRKQLKILVNGIPDNSGDFSCHASDLSTVWIYSFGSEVPVEATVEIILDHGNIDSSDAPNESVTVSSSSPYKSAPVFSSIHGSELKRTFEDQVETCNQLLELEPDSKWTLLTKQLVMHSIDVLAHRDEICLTLEKLILVDPLRSGYYLDVLSRVKIELAILQHYTEPTVDLSGARLTCFYHSQYFIFVEILNLSGNKLKHCHLKFLGNLMNCKKLILDNNEIETLLSLPLLEHLEELSATGNPLTNSLADKLYLSSCATLKTIKL